MIKDRFVMHRLFMIGRAAFAAALLALPCSPARAQSSEIVVSVTDQSGLPVTDAVVVAMPTDGKVTLPAKPREEIVDQIDKEFSPRVKPVVVGTPIRFPNHDNVRHHVYSFSGAKRFELPLYAGVPAQPVVFDKAGVVVLGCNIHDWMVGYIYVSDSPYFAKTGHDGKAVISGLPAQAFVVRTWHPLMDGGEEATRKSVDLSRTRRGELAVALKLNPEVKVRRAPVGGHAGHY
ncbi:MAG TPA: methylamine utilization protein [Casimicrobiaceae bacterium]|nr:methylamine utilization protein [Casimicrobiaceae bacterium]